MQASQFVLFLHPIWYTLYTIGYAFFDYWMTSLISKFKIQRQELSWHYAIVMLVFFLLNTLYYSFQALQAWGSFTRFKHKIERKTENAKRGTIRAAGAFLLLLTIADVAIVSGVAIWFFGFQSTGDKTDLTYCVVYGVMALLDIWSKFKIAFALILAPA